MTTTPISWPYPPRDPSGDWRVTLPGNASIGEVKVWARATAPTPGDYEAFILSLGPILYWPLHSLPESDLVHGAVASLVGAGSYTGGALNTYIGDGVVFSTTAGYGHYDDTVTQWARMATALSVVCWVKYSSTPSAASAMFDYSGADHKADMGVYTNQANDNAYQTGSVISTILSVGPTVGTALRCHGYSYSSTDGLQSWLDGANGVSITPTGNSLRTPLAHVYIGAGAGGANGLGGTMNQLAVFDRVLTGTEWLHIYNFGTTGHS